VPDVGDIAGKQAPSGPPVCLVVVADPPASGQPIHPQAMTPSRIVIDPIGRIGDHEFGCLTEREVGDELRRFDALWSELFPAEQARIVQLLVERIELSEKGADITLRTEGLASLIQDLHAVSGQRKDAA